MISNTDRFWKLAHKEYGNADIRFVVNDSANTMSLEVNGDTVKLEAFDVMPDDVFGFAIEKFFGLAKAREELTQK